MTVNPGFGGQRFIAGTLPKVETLRGWIQERGLTVALEVDGGITEDTIASAARAGANAFVAGTAIFGAPNYREAIAALRQAVSS
jgi:ribulose-phosphate 3-epimerase